MQEKNDGYLFLGRVFQSHVSENFEAMLNQKYSGHIGVETKYDISEIDTTYQPTKPEYIENYNDLINYRSYFVVGEDLDIVAEEINKVCKEPGNQHTYEVIVNDSRIDRDKDSEISFVGDDRVTMLVVKIPKVELNRMIFEGNAAKCNASYGTEQEKTYCSEYILSDKGLKEVYEKGYIMYFDNTHKVMDAISTTTFDPDNILDIDKNYQIENGARIFNYKQSCQVKTSMDYNEEDELNNEEFQTPNLSFNTDSLSAEAKLYYDGFLQVMNMPDDIRDYMLQTFKDSLDPEVYNELYNYYLKNNPTKDGYDEGM